MLKLLAFICEWIKKTSEYLLHYRKFSNWNHHKKYDECASVSLHLYTLCQLFELNAIAHENVHTHTNEQILLYFEAEIKSFNAITLSERKK